MTKLTSLPMLVLCIALAGCAGTATTRSTGAIIDDAGITAALNGRLLADPATKVLQIEVETYEGRVQLNGVVRNTAARVRAEELARATRGVKKVSNNLVVKDGSRRAGEYVDDQVLITRVNAALARNEFLSAFTVDVEAHQGAVYLGGFVITAEDRERAGTLAAGIPGVLEVVNNLELR